MEKTIEKLKGHTYLSKKGEPIKNPRINYKQVLETYSYLITKMKGKVSQRVLRLAFTDKTKDFTNVLLEDGFITKVRDSTTIRINFEDGTNKYVSTPAMFELNKKVKMSCDVLENRYINSLYRKIKTKEEYQWLSKQIEETLSRTTLDGESIGTDIKYKKGRYYGPHSTMPKETRKRLEIDGEETKSYDIRHSIFQLLSKNTIEGIMPMWTDKDFYRKMYKDFGLTKEELLKQVFCHQSQQTKSLDTIPFFSSLRDFKINNGYKMVHYIYQLCETKLMTDIYQMLRMNKIDFLPMHDSVIFKKSDLGRVLEIVDMTTDIQFKVEY